MELRIPENIESQSPLVLDAFVKDVQTVQAARRLSTEEIKATLMAISVLRKTNTGPPDGKARRKKAPKDLAALDQELSGS